MCAEASILMKMEIWYKCMLVSYKILKENKYLVMIYKTTP